MAAHLERLSGSPTDQNLRWTLKDWGGRYSAVSLYQGVVLTLAEDRRYLAQAEPVASLITRTLAPGVYLLAELDSEEAIQALHKAGVDIIARPPAVPRSPAGSFSRSAFLRSSYPRLSPIDIGERSYGAAGTGAVQDGIAADGAARSAVKKAGGLGESGDAAGFSGEQLAELSAEHPAETYKAQFRSALGKMQLPRVEQEELAARIERRLIVSESQLVGGAVRYEKLEARNLDYVGKTVVAKQALVLKSPIEVTWTAAGGGENRVLGIPEALEKSGGETILVLKPVSGENERTVPEPIRLPLGKISLLRRIKQSIFGE
jgi:hypothetical protein